VFVNKGKARFINIESVNKQTNVCKQSEINIENVNKQTNVCKQRESSVYKH
jgi:hypothetical protein